MQFKALVALSFVAAAVTASPLPGGSPVPASQCNTGPVQCCNSLQSANSNPVQALLGLLGIGVVDVNALVGLTCTPISIIGVPGNSW